MEKRGCFLGCKKKKLPVGIDDFEKLIKWRFFYVDKTLMIKDLLSSCSKINLFTRPRRFGKSLNLSMLFQSFDIDSELLPLKSIKMSSKVSVKYWLTTMVQRFLLS